MSPTKNYEVLFPKLQAHPELLKSLTPPEFEQFIAELLESFGWKIQHADRKIDGNFDFSAVSPIGPDLNATWLVECKAVPPSRPIGAKEIQDLYVAKLDADASNALLVTTGQFTNGAKDFARSKRNLRLADRKQILVWLKKSKLQSPPTIDELINIIHQSVGHELSEDRQERVVSELTPFLVNAELASFQNAVFDDRLAIQEATLATVRLTKILRPSEGSKVAIWRICSRLLREELALTPSELDELIKIAADDDINSPDDTLDWLFKHIPNKNRGLGFDKKNQRKRWREFGR